VSGTCTRELLMTRMLLVIPEACQYSEFLN